MMPNKVRKLLRVKTGTGVRSLKISSPLELSNPTLSPPVERVDFLGARPRTPPPRPPQPPRPQPRKLTIGEGLHRWMISMTLADQFEFTKAQNIFKEIIKRVPGSDANVIKSQLWANIGILHGWLGEHVQAKKSFKEALALDRGSPLYHFFCGVASYELKEYQRAIKSFRNCADLKEFWEKDFAHHPRNCDPTVRQEEWNYRFGSFDWDLKKEYVEYNIEQVERAVFYQQNDIQPPEGCGYYCPPALVMFNPPPAPSQGVSSPDREARQETPTIDDERSADSSIGGDDETSANGGYGETSAGDGDEETNADGDEQDESVHGTEENSTYEDNDFDERDTFEGIDALLLRLRGETPRNPAKRPPPHVSRSTTPRPVDRAQNPPLTSHRSTSPRPAGSANFTAIANPSSSQDSGGVVQARTAAVRLSKLRGLTQSKAVVIHSPDTTHIPTRATIEGKRRPPRLTILERRRIESFLSDRSTPPTVASQNVRRHPQAVRSSSIYSRYSIAESAAENDESDDNCATIPELAEDEDPNSPQLVTERMTFPPRTSSRLVMTGAMGPNWGTIETRLRERPLNLYQSPQRHVPSETPTTESVQTAKTSPYSQVLPRAVYTSPNTARVQSPQRAAQNPGSGPPLQYAAVRVRSPTSPTRPEDPQAPESPGKMQSRDEPRGNLRLREAPSVTHEPTQPPRDLVAPKIKRKVVPSVMMFDPIAVRPTPTQSPAPSVINLARADTITSQTSRRARSTKAKEGAIARLRQAKEQFR